VAIGMTIAWKRLLGDLGMLAIDPFWPARQHPLPSILVATALSGV
jgi:hypothetical protein